MKHYFIMLCLLILGCKVKSTDQNQNEARQEPQSDSVVVNQENSKESTTEANDESKYDPLNDFNGDYKLRSNSEAEEGSLTINYLGQNKFDVSIRKSVADFCSGDINGILEVDGSKSSSILYEGGRVITIKLAGSEIEVTDTKHLGVGVCEYGGLYVKNGQEIKFEK